VIGGGIIVCSRAPAACPAIITALIEGPSRGLERDFDNNETGSPFGTPRNLPHPGSSDDEIKDAFGEGWNPPVNPKANWFNRDTGESLRPEPNHDPPIGPHWDYDYRTNPNPEGWRIYPDGRVEPKWR
jgi:hypothetical protein